MYLHFKALHLIFVVTWFAGLFYLVRLFIYHAEDEDGAFRPRLELMQKRLWYGITWPSAVLALGFGGALLRDWWPPTAHPWLALKLALVAALFAYHLQCGRILHQQRRGLPSWNGRGLRLWNELATFFLFAIVFTATLKHTLSAGFAVLGALSLGLALWGGILLYRKLRQS